MNEEVNPNLEVEIYQKRSYHHFGSWDVQCHTKKILNEELASKEGKYPLKTLPARSQMVGKQELHHH